MKAVRKMFEVFSFTIAILAASAALTPSWARESGPDNGTDYVKVLFKEAYVETIELLDTVEINQLGAYALEPSSREWLQGKNEKGETRLSALKGSLREMQLEYQDAACEDSQGRKASICFYYGEDRQKLVLVSLGLNRLTTRDQAKAMLIHEAGHFTGEMDHLFLDALGIDLVRALARPTVLTTEASSVELVPNVFIAKTACESGTSTQAQALLKLARQDIASQCGEKRLNCDLDKIEAAYQGEAEYLSGLGFTMRVKCTLKAMLKLQ